MTLLLTFLMSLASGAGHQASSAIASKHCFSVKNKPTITFCSNATECVHFIKFWSDNHVPWTKHHPNCYSRWYCEVRWKFVATTNLPIFILGIYLKILMFFFSNHQSLHSLIHSFGLHKIIQSIYLFENYNHYWECSTKSK